MVLAALVLPQSFRLTALSDVIQCLLLFSGTVSLIPHAVRSRGRLRLFWTLIATGIGLWFAYQFVWIYFEVWLRTDVPDLCAGDMILFLHIVPLMAALALRPHAPQDEYAARLRRLDFALMMVWWVYLYVLIVIPWQYVVPNIPAYNDNLNSLYLIEKTGVSGHFVPGLDGEQGRLENFLRQSVRRQLHLRRQLSPRQLGHRPSQLLQRKPLRHSAGGFHGLDHGHRSAHPRARTASRRPLHCPHRTACGWPGWA